MNDILETQKSPLASEEIQDNNHTLMKNETSTTQAKKADNVLAGFPLVDDYVLKNL